MNVTFHRAFDVAVDPMQALEDIIEMGIERILTSGQQQTAMEGLPLLKKLVERANGRIIVMPASSITPENILTIINGVGVGEIHVGKGVSRSIAYPHAGLFNAKRWVVDERKVKTLVDTMKKVR